MKFVKKAVRSAKKAVKKRYGIGKKRTLNMSQLASDVARMVSMINAEKKTKDFPLEIRYVAQVYASSATVSSTGSQCFDISPYPVVQGTTVATRTGNSIKLCSALIECQVNQLASATLENKLIFEFWYNKGQYQTEANALAQIFSPSTFSGVIDSNSPRYQNYYGDYRLFRRHVCRIKQDQLSGDATNTTFKVPIRFNKNKGHHVRFIANTSNTTDVQNGQIFMTVRSEIGNFGTYTSLLDVPVVVPNSGYQVRCAVKHWFYDN